MLEKKLIVTAPLEDKAEADLRARFKEIIAGQTAHALYVPGLNPTAAAVHTKDQALDVLYANRDSLTAQQKANTEKIIAKIAEIKNDIVSNWCPQTQAAPDITTDRVKELALGIKGEDNMQSESEVSVTNSKPIFSDIDINRHLEHTLTVKNSTTGKIGIPDDAKRVDIYMFIGVTAPVDISNMKYIGSSARGKYTNHFSRTELGLVVWYIAVYVPKKKGASVEISAPQKGTVV